jgi:hypothetical protein
MNVVNSSWAISRVNAESKTNVSETNSVSIIRDDCPRGFFKKIMNFRVRKKLKLKQRGDPGLIFALQMSRLQSVKLARTLVAQPADATPLIQKATTGHDHEPVPSSIQLDLLFL